MAIGIPFAALAKMIPKMLVAAGAGALKAGAEHGQEQSQQEQERLTPAQQVQGWQNLLDQMKAEQPKATPEHDPRAGGPLTQLTDKEKMKYFGGMA